MLSHLGRLVLLLTILTWSLVAVAQDVPQFPSCAKLCIAKAFGPQTCLPTDKSCICTNQNFQLNVTLCVTESCTVPEALATRNASLTNCGAPVRDRSQQYVVLSNTMATIAAIFIALRFGFKIFIAKSELWWDDWFVLATMIASTPSAVITVYGTTANGLGKDIWTLRPDQITNCIFYFYIMAFLYFTQVALIKLSFIFFYLRIFPGREVQRLLWGTVVFTCMYGFCYVITTIFQCRPISYFWTKWDTFHTGSCANVNAITWSNAGISIALDIWILAIPLWQLRSLKMHWKKKIGVALMFCVGTFVTVVSILRLQSLVNFAKTSNSTWEFYDVSVWSTVEICVGIMCVCLPTLRMLMVKFFPVLAGSSYRSRGAKYYQYGSGAAELKSMGTRVQTTAVASSNGQGSDTESAINSGGIVVHKSYAVQHSDNDEVGLVDARPPTKPGRVR